MLVAVDNLQGYVHQLHLEGDVGLVSFADNPFVTIDVHDVVRRQVLYVDEREGGEADKDEDVTHKGEVVIFKLMCHDGFQLVLGQELPFLAIGADMELCEGVTGNLAVIVCSQYDTLQPHAALPDSTACQSSVRTKIGRKVLASVPASTCPCDDNVIG